VLAAEESRVQAERAGLHQLRKLDLADAREAVAAMLAVLPPARLADLRNRFASEQFLNWPQLAQLAARGVEVGAHAHWHWPMDGHRKAKDLAVEAQTSKARIETQIGPCRYFAYPFGNVRDVSRDAWRAVRDAGFSHAFTTLSGTLEADSNPWLLPRYALRPREKALGSLAPLLRAGNPRLRRWQRHLA